MRGSSFAFRKVGTQSNCALWVWQSFLAFGSPSFLSRFPLGCDDECWRKRCSTRERIYRATAQENAPGLRGRIWNEGRGTHADTHASGPPAKPYSVFNPRYPSDKAKHKSSGRCALSFSSFFTLFSSFYLPISFFLFLCVASSLDYAYMKLFGAFADSLACQLDLLRREL